MVQFYSEARNKNLKNKKLVAEVVVHRSRSTRSRSVTCLDRHQLVRPLEDVLVVHVFHRFRRVDPVVHVHA